MTRDELRMIPELRKKIDRERERLVYLKSKSTSIGSMNTDERVQTSVSNRSDVYIVAAVDLEKNVEKNEAVLTEAIRYVEKLIKPLQGAEKEVLKLRYIDGLTWFEVADVMCYSVSHVHYIEGRALDGLEI